MLARRLGLAAAAQRDVAGMSAPVRAAFEAYAGGVNAAIADGAAPPPGRYEAEPWRAWHSVAAFLVRHVLMGQWQHKLANAVLLARIGPSAFARLRRGRRSGRRSPCRRAAAVGAGVRLLDDALADVVGTWVSWPRSSRVERVGGQRAPDRPRRGGDLQRLAPGAGHPERVLAVPGVVPGLRRGRGDVPGAARFPHFGFNGSVGWAITHADADSQDLYLERFSGARYLTEDGWAPADLRQERIEVRGGPPVTVPAWATRHGPIVHGSPDWGSRWRSSGPGPTGPTAASSACSRC